MHGALGELFDEIGWAGGAITVLTGTTVLGWIKVWSGQFKLLKSASLATLHSQLYEKGGKYIKRGEITLSELDDLEYTWKAYHGLKGNGTGKIDQLEAQNALLRAQVKALQDPKEEPEKEG